jgi:hypothetical protein
MKAAHHKQQTLLASSWKGELQNVVFEFPLPYTQCISRRVYTEFIFSSHDIFLLFHVTRDKLSVHTATE